MGEGQPTAKVDGSGTPDAIRTWLTPRLQLVPIEPSNAEDLWVVHNDPAVAPWYGGWRPTHQEAHDRAREIAESWRLHGVHKWLAYDRATGEVIGRGGLSRTPVNDDWGQIYALLPDEPWTQQPYHCEHPFTVHASWLEIGWALRREHWGKGLASEIGSAGLTYGFRVLGAQAVVSCALRSNSRSRAVMERIGMRYVGEIWSPEPAEDADAPQRGAPFAVCAILRSEFERCTPPS